MLRLLEIVLAACLAAASTTAQCGPEWHSTLGPTTPSIYRVLDSTSWDPDGAGPRPAGFAIAWLTLGQRDATVVAAYDAALQLWSTVLIETSIQVRTLTALPNGDLVVGGSFSAIAGVAANNIARWDGSTWTAFGSGLDGDVVDLATLPNGDLVAAGVFTGAGGAAQNIARWDGSTWLAMGWPTSNDQIDALLTTPNGDLVAAGPFHTSRAAPANHVARWSNGSWLAYGSGPAQTKAIATLPNGDLVALTDSFTHGRRLERWDGLSWSTVTGVSAPYSLVNETSGAVVVGGDFTMIGGMTAHNIAKWDGVTWFPMGDGQSGSPTELGIPSRALLLGSGPAGSVLAFALPLGTPWLGVWNGSTWANRERQFNGRVFDVVTRPNGELVAAGSFTRRDGVEVNHVAGWDGQSWQPLGSGMMLGSSPTGADVYDLEVLPSGDVIAIGIFTSAGGVVANHIARWDGSSWSALGSGLNFAGQAIAAMPNGDLIAGGNFTGAGGVAVNRIARWDGTSWSPLGSGVSGQVNTLLALPNGNLIAGGWFTNAGGGNANHIAQWNGTSWTPLAAGCNAAVRCLHLGLDGSVIAGGDFTTAGSANVSYVAAWHGTNWSAIGTSSQLGDTVYALATTADGTLVAGGRFTDENGDYFARLDGNSWEFEPGLDGPVLAITKNGSGRLTIASESGTTPTVGRLTTRQATGFDAVDVEPGIAFTMASVSSGRSLVVAGALDNAGTSGRGHVAMSDGSHWQVLGNGPGLALCQAIAEHPNGDILVGGYTPTAGSAVWRWNGSAWAPLGTGALGLNVLDLAVEPGGQVVAASGQNTPTPGVARWDGTAWQLLGLADRSPWTVAVLPNGHVVAGGLFSVIGGTAANCIAVWDGASWAPFGVGMASSTQALGVWTLLVLPNGDLLAGGTFSSADGVPANNIARWDGNSWSPLGAGVNGPVGNLALDTNGDILAVGQFTTAGGIPANRIARWNGSAWSPLGDGLNGEGWYVAATTDGRVHVAGPFTQAGSVPTSQLAHWSTSCPAGSSQFGSACGSTGGPMHLTAATAPWTGATFDGECSGMGTNAIGAALLGFANPSQPLAALHPTAGAACLLQTSADAQLLLLPSAGQATFGFSMPADPAYAGLTFWSQVLQMELDAQGGLLELSGSNSLHLMLGSR